MYCRCGKKSVVCCFDCDNRYFCIPCDFTTHDRNIRSDHSRIEANRCQLCCNDIGLFQCHDCPAQKGVRGILLCLPCFTDEHSSICAVNQQKLFLHTCTSVPDGNRLNIAEILSKKRKEGVDEGVEEGVYEEVDEGVDEESSDSESLENLPVILHDKATFCACMTNEPIFEVPLAEKVAASHLIKIKKALILGIQRGSSIDDATRAIRTARLEMEMMGNLNCQPGNARSVCFYKRESDILVDKIPVGRWISKLAQLISEIFYVKFFVDRDSKGFVFYGHPDQVDIACSAFELCCNRTVYLSLDMFKKQDCTFMQKFVEILRKAQEEEKSDYRKSGESLVLNAVRISNYQTCMKITVEVEVKLKLKGISVSN